MNAIEIRGLTRRFGDKLAVNGLNMTVPVGAIYGFIGENGSGKSTTEKLICGLLHPDAGSIKLFGRDSNADSARSGLGVLIESPGCYPNCTVWDNMMFQAANLHLKNPDKAVRRALKQVRMEGSASNRYKNCSLGMKQRVGIAMALLGHPNLLILDEPVNGLDADGMRILREVLTRLARDENCTVLISSHILGELEKIATHYGILRNGRMLTEMTAGELQKNCRTYISLRADDMDAAGRLLRQRYARTETDESGNLRIYDAAAPRDAAEYLWENGVVVSRLETGRISLEEYYIDLMNERRANRDD